METLTRATVFAFVLTCAAAFTGCWEAESDQDTMGDLRDSISTIPIELRGAMAKWAANRIAYGYLLRYQNDSLLGTISCQDPNGIVLRTEHIPMSEMYKCLNTMQTSTFAECVAYILRDFNDIYPDEWCNFVGFQRGLDPSEVPAEFNADRVTLDHITEALLGPPPPAEIQLLLMGLAGVMGPAGFLCIQTQRGWACAPGPFEGEPTTTSASSGGGDQ